MEDKVTARSSFTGSDDLWVIRDTDGGGGTPMKGVLECDHPLLAIMKKKASFKRVLVRLRSGVDQETTNNHRSRKPSLAYPLIFVASY